MTTYLLTILGIFGIMLIGVGTERLYRYFQSKHPELGPYRRRDGGCNCHCSVCDAKDCADGNGKDSNVQPPDSRSQ